MEESSERATTASRTKSYWVKEILRYALIGTLALSLGYLHYAYVGCLFENDRNFSLLSETEREMSFPSEMGFYYSYYKTVVEERPFIAGISKLMYDRLVEYPKDVNTFNRFNIAPEVIIGAAYRYMEPWLNTSAHRECHMVYRGDDVEPVYSCVGLGQPVMFYLEAIWCLAGLLVAVIFISGYSLSKSLLGGSLAVVQYFANHAEVTRVQWAPNERENLAVPLLCLQMALLTAQLRARSAAACRLQISIFILNCLCLLFWQFSQFIFLTQTAIFFLMEQFRIIDLKTLGVFLHSHFCGLHMAVLLLQGNDMLKTSLYTSFFLMVSAYCLLFSSFRIKVQNRMDLFVEAWLIVLRVLIVTAASFYLKYLTSDFLEVEDDTHIWDILYSKFTNFKSFHTLIYTCSEVFDFLPFRSVINMTKTGLIPMVLISIFNCFYSCIKNGFNGIKNDSSRRDGGVGNNTDNNSPQQNLDVIDKEEPQTKDAVLCFMSNLKIDPAAFYNIAQLVVFAIMAGLVMRLKLLFGMQMCIVAALFMSEQRYMVPKWMKKYLSCVHVTCLLALLYHINENVNAEMSHMGEFSNFRQEELLKWISRETGASASFAGSMPLLATVMLVTRRPIVAHPHYENKEARDRAYSMYKMYGKFSTEELYKELTGLKAMYVIVEKVYCYGRSSKGCSFEEIWDMEAPEHRDKPRTCHALLTEPAEHFYPVFRNEHYAVFRLHDYSVQYMPRSFDT